MLFKKSTFPCGEWSNLNEEIKVGNLAIFIEQSIQIKHWVNFLHFIGENYFSFNLKYPAGILNNPIFYLEMLYYKIRIGVLS